MCSITTSIAGGVIRVSMSPWAASPLREGITLATQFNVLDVVSIANGQDHSLLGGGNWTMNIKSLYQKDESGIQGTCHSFMTIDPDCCVGWREFTAHGIPLAANTVRCMS